MNASWPPNARWCAVAVAVFVSALAPRACADDAPTFGLSISVARKDGAPVQSEAWIAEQIVDANALYGPLGVIFRWTLAKELSEERAELHSRADRDALAPLSDRGGVIDVFVVAALEDVDEPGRYRKGVCWTSRPDKKRYIVLSSAAPRTVLAHELGHFFGNGHTTVTDNVMSYARTGGPIAFDPLQIATIRSFSRRFLETKRLVDAGPPRLLP